MNATAVFISLAFDTRTYAHKAHLSSRVYASHVALEAYYNGIIPMVDKFTETYQGIFGIIEDYPDALTLPKDPVQMLTVFRNWVVNTKSLIAPTDDLMNQVEEIVSFVNQTLYKLNYLE